MAEEFKKWTEDQIVAAFNNFRDSNAAESSEEAERRLRSYLKEQGRGPYGKKDIMEVAAKMVSLNYIGGMVYVVVDWLDENIEPVAVY